MLAVLSITTYAFHADGGKDPLEKTFIKNSKVLPNALYQESLRSSPAWQHFIRQNGDWYVTFDEHNQMPHRASGKPVPVTGETAQDASWDFITHHLTEFNFPVTDLAYQSSNFYGNQYNVFYSQSYQGLPVLNSRVFIKMTADHKVFTFGLDVHTISGLDVHPLLSMALAVAKASENMPGPVSGTSQPVLKVLPVPADRSYDYHLVYELTVTTSKHENTPAIYYTLVDANTGEILYRQNRVMYLTNDATVTGTASLLNPYNPGTVVPLPNLMVNDGTNTYYTDSLGYVSIPGSSPISATFSLEGLWSQVVTDQGSTSPSTVVTLNPGSNSVDFDPVASIRHISGYYHVNIVHDFMKPYFPGFTDLDFPLPTRIDVSSGTCNAFYSGSDINFYATGGGCNCMSQIGDVVYHEYGHGINDWVYQWQGGSFDNSGMNEGYADVWGLSITKSPILGQGYSTSGAASFIRRYDVNPKVYPQDLTGESHDDGEIIAGAWYDVSVNMGSWSAMTALFASTFYDLVTGPDGSEGQVYSDVLLAALNRDDNDGDLSNGTPHDQAIIDAFALHGISLLNNVTFAHTEILSGLSGAPIPVTANITLQFPWMSTTLNLVYKSGNGSWNTLPMTSLGGSTYEAFIPTQPAGTIVSYYIQLLDGSSNPVKTQPAEADLADPNIPYYILVDYMRERIEDFDANQTPGWLTGIPSDNASTGIWEIAVPVPSYESPGVECAPGTQHTPAGSQCAVTGNAASPSDPIGDNDIDGGATTLQSPAFDVSSYADPVVSYWRWYTNDQGSTPRTDFWQTWISGDGVNFVPVENIDVPDHSWRRFAFRVNDYLTSPSSVTLRFTGEDAGSGSLVEASLDDIEIYDRSTNTGIREPQQLVLGLFPNPANGSFTLNVTSPESGISWLKIIDNLGKEVRTEKVNLNSGLNSFHVDIRDIARGIYRVVLRNETGQVSRQLSVM